MTMICDLNKETLRNSEPMRLLRFYLDKTKWSCLKLINSSEFEKLQGIKGHVHGLYLYPRCNLLPKKAMKSLLSVVLDNITIDEDLGSTISKLSSVEYMCLSNTSIGLDSELSYSRLVEKLCNLQVLHIISNNFVEALDLPPNLRVLILSSKISHIMVTALTCSHLGHIEFNGLDASKNGIINLFIPKSASLHTIKSDYKIKFKEEEDSTHAMGYLPPREPAQEIKALILVKRLKFVWDGSLSGNEQDFSNYLSLEELCIQLTNPIKKALLKLPMGNRSISVSIIETYLEDGPRTVTEEIQLDSDGPIVREIVLGEEEEEDNGICLIS